MATVQLRLTPADHGRRMTLEEFREAEEEEGYRFELGGGILEVTEIPGPAHARVVCNLYRASARYDREHPGIVAIFGGGSEFRLWMPQVISGRNPDLGVALEGSALDERGHTPPALVAEVVSESSRKRDYVTKRQEYLTYPSVREYWIVDPKRRQVTVLFREGEDWTERVVGDDELIPSQVLPGLACRVSDLWVGVVAREDEE